MTIPATVADGDHRHGHHPLGDASRAGPLFAREAPLGPENAASAARLGVSPGAFFEFRSDNFHL